MMQYEFNNYRTSDGSLDIAYLLVEVHPSNWRAYILTDIDYKGRSTSVTTIHRLTESDENMKLKIRNFIRNNNVPYRKSDIHYICWSKTVTSLESIREVAKTWSEITAYYIKHGGTFQTIQPILKSQGVISI